MAKARKDQSADESLFESVTPAQTGGNGAETSVASADAGSRTPPARRGATGEGAGAGGGSGSSGSAGGSNGDDDAVALHDAAQTRYLNYALSVITSRALPDVRDGLKPVQRRILYSMWQQGVTFDAKHRKCANIVGAVMGNYHPHGDSAIYEALVRMAQPFSLRYPLIDGSGNFGSLDGDNAAAMRYTECRLAAIAGEMLSEIGQQTVHFRPNYDGTKSEPVVLPARLPNLLINGSMGIAVGMATNIPPHNLGEVCTALLKLLENPELKTEQLCRYVKGPDFPTGGQILNTPEEIREIYREGHGSIRLRATWEPGPTTRSSKTIYITSVPYTVNKAVMVERIADVVVGRKMPLLLDVRDLSTDDVRVALELKRDADEQKVLAYLFKHTPMQISFGVNLTCLIPTENPEVGRPERCDLREILQSFLQFRLEVVTRRLEHELRQLEARIHILEGFATVFDALDAIIKIIRASDGKADAAQKIMAKFPLDAEQTDAILELKLYRLAKLEILVIRQELDAKRARAAEIRTLLDETEATGRWGIVRDEITEIRDKYGKPSRRLTLIEAVTDEPEYTAEDFIIDEDSQVIVTRDGWVKRQKERRDPSSTRLREGDTVLAAEFGSTRASIVFFSNFGTAYTCRIVDIPPSTGYGEPIQKLFKFKDGEQVVAAMSLDPREIGQIRPLGAQAADAAKASADPDDEPALIAELDDSSDGDDTTSTGVPVLDVPPVHALAVTSDGMALRFSFESVLEPSTRNGRRYARVRGEAGVVGVVRVTGTETILAATQQARGMVCPVSDVNFLAGAGKGVTLIKLQKNDRVLAFKASRGDRDLLTMETSRGAAQTISTAKYEPTRRGGKGRELLKRGTFARVIPEGAAGPSSDASNTDGGASA